MAKKATKTNDIDSVINEKDVVTSSEAENTTKSPETIKEKAPEATPEPETAENPTEETTEEPDPQTPETFTKSGKKSKKHIEEVRAEEERQAKKAEAAAEAEKKSGPKPKTRSKLERRGKNYRKVAEKIEKGKAYPLKEALELAIATCPVKFDSTLEAHFRLGVDPRQADQNIRATLSLPGGSGKTIRIAVFAPLDQAKSAKTTGADIAEDEEFLKRLDKGTIDFDVLVTTPAYMPKLGKYARLLGPKGLMPNPKAGTVTNDIDKAVKELKGGKIEYRVDKQAIVHVGLGKVSFGTDKLLQNVEAMLDSLKSQKPASLKGTYIKSFYLTTTMGPSVQVENTYN